MSYESEVFTFATSISVCAACKHEVVNLRHGEDGITRNMPCGHVAGLELVPNPSFYITDDDA